MKKLLGGERGLFTIEGSIVFPAVFIVIVCTLILSFYVFQQAVLYEKACVAAERAAFVWNNSNRDPLTGASNDRYDGLYWRIFQDRSAHTEGSVGHTVQTLPAAEKEDLSSVKLLKVARMLPQQVDRSLDFRNKLIYRSIDVRLTRSLGMPGLFYNLLHVNRVAVASASYIAEPVEFIRTLDMLRQYGPYLKNAVGSDELKQDIKTVSGEKSETAPADTELAFSSHNEARAYLQRLVNGKLSSRSTTTVGSWRMIDALDPWGVAHQCYFGYKTMKSMEIRPQYEKDAELLRKGEVSGVVWHFFKRKSDHSVGLSPELRAQLEKRGIVVVVHDQQ